MFDHKLREICVISLSFWVFDNTYIYPMSKGGLEAYLICRRHVIELCDPLWKNRPLTIFHNHVLGMD